MNKDSIQKEEKTRLLEQSSRKSFTTEIVSFLNEKFKNENKLDDEYQNALHHLLYNADRLSREHEEALLGFINSHKESSDRDDGFFYKEEHFENIEPASWLVPDILPQKTIGLFVGDAGVGKTTVALWLVREVLKNHDNTYVFYIDGDMTPTSMASYGVPELKSTYKERLEIAGRGQMDLSERTQRLMREIALRQKNEPEKRFVVIEDSLIVLAKKKKGFIDTEFLYLYEKLLRDVGGTVVVLHHNNKQGVFADSQQIMNYADYSFDVKRNSHNSSILLFPTKASRYDIKETAFAVKERRVLDVGNFDELNISDSDSRFISGIQSIFRDYAKGINQGDLVDEAGALFKKCDLGQDRGRKKLIAFAKKGFWRRVQTGADSNVALYFANSKKQQKRKI